MRAHTVKLIREYPIAVSLLSEHRVGLSLPSKDKVFPSIKSKMKNSYLFIDRIQRIKLYIVVIFLIYYIHRHLAEIADARPYVVDRGEEADGAKQNKTKNKISASSVVSAGTGCLRLQSQEEVT